MLRLLQLIKLLKSRAKNWWVKRKRGPVRKEIIINLKIHRSDESGEKKDKVETRTDGSPLLILPTDSVSTVHYFMNKNKGLMYGFLFNQLRVAVRNDWPFTELFRVGHTQLVAKIESKDYEKSILDMQQYFATEAEDYKRAALCTELLDKNRVNKALAKMK